MIDYGKVNLRFKGSTGAEDVLGAGKVERCDPVNGGWYYDVVATGTPTRVIACEATCRKFKADPSASVELTFGCRTRYVP